MFERTMSMIILLKHLNSFINVNNPVVVLLTNILSENDWKCCKAVSLCFTGIFWLLNPQGGYVKIETLRVEFWPIFVPLN